MALKELSSFTRMRREGTFKPISPETRKVLTRRLSPSINEIERHAVRCLIFTEHPETGQSSLWCAYGPKLKVFNITTWMCDPNDLHFPSLITSMCVDARYKLWIRCIEGQLFVVDTLTRMFEGELDTNDGENGCQTIVFDPMHNHILTANRMGLITVWNASSWERLYEMNLLEMYQKAHNIQDKKYVSQAVVTLQTNKEPAKVEKTSNRKLSFLGNPKESITPINIPDLPSFNAPAQINPSPNDKLERIQIYEDLLFACYRDDYIIVLRMSDSNVYTYEHLISIKYKTGNALPIDAFLIYNKQLWVSTGCIISIFDVNETYDENAYNLIMKKPVDENAYNLIMKKPVDDDNIMTMLGFSGFVWAGSLNGSIYVYRMDNYELYKTFSGHRDSVYCLCPMLDTYVVSGSAERDTSIAIWENVLASTT
jgi:WD40 repeat protein